MGKLKDLFKRKKRVETYLSQPKSGGSSCAPTSLDKEPEITIEELTKKANDGWSVYFKQKARLNAAGATSASEHTNGTNLSNTPAANVAAGQHQRTQARTETTEHDPPIEMADGQHAPATLLPTLPRSAPNVNQQEPAAEKLDRFAPANVAPAPASMVQDHLASPSGTDPSAGVSTNTESPSLAHVHPFLSRDHTLVGLEAGDSGEAQDDKKGQAAEAERSSAVVPPSVHEAPRLREAQRSCIEEADGKAIMDPENNDPATASSDGKNFTPHKVEDTGQSQTAVPVPLPLQGGPAASSLRTAQRAFQTDHASSQTVPSNNNAQERRTTSAVGGHSGIRAVGGALHTSVEALNGHIAAYSGVLTTEEIRDIHRRHPNPAVAARVLAAIAGARARGATYNVLKQSSDATNAQLNSSSRPSAPDSQPERGPVHAQTSSTPATATRPSDQQSMPTGRTVSDSSTSLASQPRLQTVLRPRTPPETRQPRILKLPSEIILRIGSYLGSECTSAAFFKVSHRSFNQIISLAELNPTVTQQLAVLRGFPPTRWFAGDRSPPLLCKDCVMWHSFEKMVIYPYPRPESKFMSHADFTVQKPRVCVRHAVKTGAWKRGGRLDARHVLCEKCITPQNEATTLCSWNCDRCDKCTNRKGWSGYCKNCWRSGDSLVLQKDTPSGPEIRLPFSNRFATGIREGWVRGTLNDHQEERMRCGRCLGLLDVQVGSPEYCRCLAPRHNICEDRWL